MRKFGLLVWWTMVTAWAGEMPEKAAGYLAALEKRPESAALFDRFRDAWLEERSVEDLEKELLARTEANDASAWPTLARAYLAQGKTEKALAAFDKARQQTPTAWLDLETARLRLMAKDFAAAEKDALAVPEGNALRLDALKLAGLASMRAERIDDALAHWTKAVAAAPGDIGLLEDLTELTRREGRLDLALDYCGKWRDATKDAYGKAMATLRRSELLLGSQRFDEAMTELIAVLEVSADDSWLERETLARAEQAHRQRGNTTGWATWVGALAEAHPVRLNFRRTHSQALAAAGKSDEALDVLTEVMRRSPGDTAVRWQRIGLLEQAMKLEQAFTECAELAAKEKSEAARLRLAELAFRLEKKAELKQALDDVMAATEPAKVVGLASLYARYGLPAESERIWRQEAGGEQGGQALRQLAKHLKTAGREAEAIETWKQLGAREVALDRIEAAQMLSSVGQREAAQAILENGRARFSTDPAYEAAVADLALAAGRADEARAIYLNLARVAKQPDALMNAIKGWLRTTPTATEPLKDLGEETADRCIRAAWLAAAGKPLPPVRDGDALERPVRQALLREQGRWADVVKMMEAVPGERGPLFLSEMAEAKMAAGDFAGALATAQAWRERAVDQPGAWLFEAGTLEKLGKIKDATLLMRRAAARFEDNEDVARRLFSLLQETLDPRESLEWAWKRHDRSQDETIRTNWLREILRVSKEREKLDDLKERFEERVRRDPASPGPLVALAELAKARGESREELDLLRRAAVNAPRDSALISALATLEERSGETVRALERYAVLARLAPGPDSARQLAQAKIRLGDIEGGMRDMQALAGEKGLDLTALEQTAGNLAARGYVEEAIRILNAVDPAQRTARLYFVLGMLLESDGREQEAVEAFMKVLNEPDDPAEAAQRAAYGHSGQTRQISQLLQNYSGREERVPGSFRGLQVPQSLVEAKMMLKPKLVRLAIEHGGEIWSKMVTFIPELATATPEQWREAMDFQRASNYGNQGKWWDFMEEHPGNPLGVELLIESGQTYNAKPEQVDTILKTHSSPQVQMLLRSANRGWRKDDLEFLEAMEPAFWQDEAIRKQALQMVGKMFNVVPRDGIEISATASERSRAIAVLEKIELSDDQKNSVLMLKALAALLEKKPDDFVKWANTWAAVSQRVNRENIYYHDPHSPFVTAFFQWQKQAGDKAAEAVIAKIDSPVLRCQLSEDPTPERRLARLNRELAALPKDAPVTIRRSLIRLKWLCRGQGEGMNENLRKELESASEDPDPRLAFEAKFGLINFRQNHDGNLAEEDRLKLEEMLVKVAASPDAADQSFAKRYQGYLSGNSRRSRVQAPPPVTRWGTSSNSYSSGYSGQNRSAMKSIIEMEDKEQAVREAARLLEDAARGSVNRSGSVGDEIKALSEAGLLEDALTRISLPPEAGLGRRVAMLMLLDACGKADRARSLVEELVKSWPRETHWTVELALRTPDDAEMRRLLDSVAERGDFDRILGNLMVSQNAVTPGALFPRLKRLADWAPQAKGRRAWMEPVMMMLANGGSGGLSKLAAKNSTQLEIFHRYVNLALDDKHLAEIGFRVSFATRYIATPEAITDAARRALLAGAYTASGPLFANGQSPSEMQLAALEHLVLAAEKDGDAVAFPADFRERLKVADPETEAWLAKMLAAKTVADLPDVSNAAWRTSGWVAQARHEAALLRAVKLSGREAWLTKIFREKQYQAFSENLRHVIRESLLEAGKSKAISARALAFLEAAAGPRKNWGKKISAPENAQVRTISAQDTSLQNAADAVLNAAMTTDTPTLLALLDFYREARIPVSNTDSVFTKLGQWWTKEMNPPRNATLPELLGKQSAYTLGFWQGNRGSTGEIQFFWGLPTVLRNLQRSEREQSTKAAKNNPEASFPDLVQAWLATGDKFLQRRALVKAAPDLAKLPKEIRRPVIAALIEGMALEYTVGIHPVVAAHLREILDAQSAERVKAARVAFNSLKANSAKSPDQSYQLGSMLGMVIADDEAFFAEVLAHWRPTAEADASGKIMEAFIGGLVSNSRQNPRAMFEVMRLCDSLWKGSPPPARANSQWGNPMVGLLSQQGTVALQNPQLWQQVATLSPKFQAQFWLSAAENGNLNGLDTDPKLLEKLREAAKGGEVTRTALEVFLQSAAMQRGGESKRDGAALLAFAKALKEVGVSPVDLSALLSRFYSRLSQMENVGPLLAEIPILLDGLKTFPEEHSGNLFQGLQNLWEKAQQNARKASGNRSEIVAPTLAYPVETKALLKFVFARSLNPSRSSYYGSGMTPMVLATGDAELLELWLKVGGKALGGDLALIVTLLEKDRVAEAIALAPAAGRSFNTSRRFDSHLESLISKLSSVSAPQTFRLRARLSMLPDVSEAAAPSEKYNARRVRLLAEFEGARNSLSLADRADICLLLGLHQATDQKHVPALDEFANEAAAKALKKSFITGESSSASTTLFIPAVCSRVFADDLSGITLLTAAVPPGSRDANSFLQSSVYPIQHCLIAYVNRHDGIIPEPSVEIILAYAKAIADGKNPICRGIAFQYVHLVTSDAASLEAGLKSCGLEGVKPSAYVESGATPATMQALMRLALLHPTASEVLLESLGTPAAYYSNRGAMLPSLHEPKLRAKISPTLFLSWNRILRTVTPEDLEVINLYATERRNDFDEAQRAELDGWLQRLSDTAKRKAPVRFGPRRGD